MKKIVVIINKNWETEPVLNALTNSEIRPKELPFPVWVNSPKDGKNRMNAPRVFLTLSNDKSVSAEITIWCIQDLMNTQKSSSSSEEKFNVLPQVIRNEKPDLIMAVGTAGYLSEQSYNGSVFIGSNFFLHDGHPDNNDSNLKNENVGKLLSSNVNNQLYDIFSQDFRDKVEKKFISVPNLPAQKMQCLASIFFAALSNINVTDYKEYRRVDNEGIKHFKDIVGNFDLCSIETTHGVIKLCSEKPTIFISAITDRVGYFDSEVNALQNYVASFNAGIVIGQLLCSLNDYILKGNEFTIQ